MEVGVREFRDNLSRWIAAVRDGEEIVITDRGRPVARLIGATSPPSLDRLVAAGLVQLPKRPKEPAGRPRVRGRGPISDLVSEQRG
jgi:prevent-host-death family protein